VSRNLPAMCGDYGLQITAKITQDVGQRYICMGDDWRTAWPWP